MSTGTIRVQNQFSIIKLVGETSRINPMKELDYDIEVDRFCDGEIDLVAGQVDYVLSGVTGLTIYSEDEFIIKKGGPTGTQIQTNIFAYNGPEADFYIDNPDLADPITLEYFSFLETSE